MLIFAYGVKHNVGNGNQTKRQTLNFKTPNTVFFAEPLRVAA